VAIAFALGLSASAHAWHYKFQDFVEGGNEGASAFLSKVEKCGGGKFGDYRYLSRGHSSVPSSDGSDHEFEIEVRAKMPITAKFKKVHDVDVAIHATYPADPATAEFLHNYHDGIAEGQQNFYDAMFVRFDPGKKKDHLEIRHNGLYYFGNESLPPGEFKTDFKFKPGC
jgi:hypothetical protein